MTIRQERRRMNNYKLLRVLGKGGMSVVYLAEHTEYHTLWAVKQVHKQEEVSFDVLAEPTILKELSHPMLPLIMDILEDKENLYVVEEYIEGQNLRDYCKEQGQIDEDRVLTWFSSLCDVLSYLHNQTPHPIIFRDLKPSNIMLRPDGSLCLVDFGIARHYKKDSRSDTVLAGTRGYAAPEQFSGDAQTDNRSDIYSLGVTIYQLITGKSPYDPPYEILPARKVNPKCSAGLEYILLKCTKRDPAERYQSVEEIKNDIAHIKDLENKKSDQRLKTRRRNIFAAILLCSIALLGILWHYHNVQQAKYEEAQTAMKEECCDLGKIQMEQDNYENAVKEFQRALDVDEDYIPGLMGNLDAWIAIARNAQTPEDTEFASNKAEDFYDRILNLKEEVPETKKNELTEIKKLVTYRLQYKEIGNQLYKAFKNNDYDKVESIILDSEYKDALESLNKELTDNHSYYIFQNKDGKALVLYQSFYFYYGGWKKEKRTGEGIWFYTDTEKTLAFYGIFSKDKPNGPGNYYEKNKKENQNPQDNYIIEELWKGSFKNGKYHGEFMVSWRMNKSIRNFSLINYKEGKAEKLSFETIYEHYIYYGDHLESTAEFIKEDTKKNEAKGLIPVGTFVDNWDDYRYPGIFYNGKDNIYSIPGF